MTRRTFIHHGHTLAYEVYGDEGFPCLLMHGLLLDTLLYRDLAPRFVAEGYRVILLDLLGHGQSDKPTDPREHRIDFYAEQAIACLDHLGFERAVVGGISLGALVSLQVAARVPERCAGLLLEMPLMEWSTTFAAAVFAPLVGIMRMAEPALRLISGALQRMPRPRTAWAASLLNAASLPPAVMTAVLHGVLVGPVVPPQRVRRSLAMPTLIIGHAHDRLHSLRDARTLAEELPNVRLATARSILELRLNPDRLWPDIADLLRRARGVG